MSKVFNRDVELAGTSRLMKNGTVLIDESGNIDAPTTTTNLTASGNTTLGDSTSDTTAVNGTLTVTSTSASATAIGRNGSTNPALTVDASTSSSATGIKVKSAAAAGGVAVSVTSSGTDENLSVDAKGSGTITLGGTSTGNIVLSRAMTGVSSSYTGGATLYSATAVPAGGTTGSGLKMSSTTNLGVFFGSGAPTLSAAQGSLYLRTDGSSTSTRLYVNTNGSTTWTNVTTAA